MSPQQKMVVELTKRLLLLIVLGAAAIFLFKAVYALGQSQRSEPRRINGKLLADKEPLTERTSFTENGPSGRWSASIIPDLSRDSSTSPVVVVGTSALMGNSQWKNLQLTHVSLKNHSSKTVLGVQLKWFITTKEDRFKVLPPPGYTGLIEAHLDPGEKRQVESPLIKFSQAVKYLTKNDSLEGDFLLQIRVFEAEFEDGTTWNDDWGGPKPGDRGEPWRGVYYPDSYESMRSRQNSSKGSYC